MAPKATLARLALDPAGPRPERGAGASHRTAVLDRAQRLPGRGAYVCRDERDAVPAAACLRRALQRGGLSRAFRARVSIGDEFVESTV